MRIRYRHRPRHTRTCYWLDLDNTLHQADTHILPEINAAMTAYLAQHLNRPPAEASRLRTAYWLRYGATLLGLVRHHPHIDPHHFLATTHALPNLERQVAGLAHVHTHLRKLSGMRILLTNAPRAYARRVLRALGLQRLIHAVVAIEDMRLHGQWRPKPSTWLWQRLKAVRPSGRHVLVDDTRGHLKKAAAQGFETVWVQQISHPGSLTKRNVRHSLVRASKRTI
ncbi:MAG: HAD family hydrolase [Burkholderiaceae bacterium]